jgi:hypothetical protein
MPPITPNSLAAIQPELTSGESILWAGQPNTRVSFHKEDLFLIPFSLMWGGFAIFWEGAVAGYWGSSGTRSGQPWVFGMIWGIPFVLIGHDLGKIPLLGVEKETNSLCGNQSPVTRCSKRLEASDGVGLH